MPDRRRLKLVEALDCAPVRGARCGKRSGWNAPFGTNGPIGTAGNESWKKPYS